MPLPARIKRQVIRQRKLPREGDSKSHLTWIKTLPCLLCGRMADHPHHLLRGVDSLPKGMGRTNPDRWAIPACWRCHEAIHGAADDEAFLAARGYSGRDVAFALWGVSGDTEAGLRIVLRAFQAARLNRKAAE